MVRTARFSTAVVFALTAMATAACTSGNIVSNFEEPSYTVVDTLEGGVEIRRYDARALAAETVADADVEGSVGEIDAAVVRSGLVAVLTTSDQTTDAERQALLAALEKSPRWQADGDATLREGDETWAFLGMDQNELAVPIRRTPDLAS